MFYQSTRMSSRIIVVRLIAAATMAVTAAVAVAGLGAAPAVAAPAAGSSCRTIPVDADPVLRSDLARLDFGVDGTGVRVGIISNSFFLNSTNSTLEENVADGLLPGPGNPCGYQTPVDVALEAPSEMTSSDDEGRGMAQLVHGVAPGAEIVFASAVTQGGMDAALSKLKERDVDVIVDDMSVYNESWFQESQTSQTIDGLVAQGITYFSAAANETVLAQNPPAGVPSTPVNGWQTAAYRPADCEEPLKSYIHQQLPDEVFDCMDFDVDAGVDTENTYTVGLQSLLPPGATTAGLEGWLQWGEPFKGVQTPFQLIVAATDLQGEVSYFVSSEYQAGDPVSTIPVILDSQQYGDTVSLDMSLVRYTEAPLVGNTPPVSFLFTANGPQWIDSVEYWQSNASDTVGRTVTGHNGAPSVITVAATDGTDDDRIDYYSSLGPVTYYLTPETASGQASRLEAPEVHARPVLMSVDNIRNSVLSTPTSTPGVFRFRGTSAASPNAAAVAALALQLNPALSPSDIRRLMVDTATPLRSPYATIPERDSVGAGLLDAYAMLGAVPKPVGPQPARLAQTGSESPVGILFAGGLFVLAGAVLIGTRRRTA